jgi:hypothetical protein
MAFNPLKSKEIIPQIRQAGVPRQNRLERRWRISSPVSLIGWTSQSRHRNSVPTEPQVVLGKTRPTRL